MNTIVLSFVHITLYAITLLVFLHIVWNVFIKKHHLLVVGSYRNLLYKWWQPDVGVKQNMELEHMNMIINQTPDYLLSVKAIHRVMEQEV